MDFMTTAKVFKSGNSQAVRLPKQFRLKSTEVDIFRRGNELILRERPANLLHAYDLLFGMPDDFEVPRKDDLPQRRKGL